MSVTQTATAVATVIRLARIATVLRSHPIVTPSGRSH